MNVFVCVGWCSANWWPNDVCRRSQSTNESMPLQRPPPHPLARHRPRPRTRGHAHVISAFVVRGFASEIECRSRLVVLVVEHHDLNDSHREK